MIVSDGKSLTKMAVTAKGKAMDFALSRHAEHQCKQALKIDTKLGNLQGLATTKSQLGVLVHGLVAERSPLEVSRTDRDCSERTPLHVGTIRGTGLYLLRWKPIAHR